METTMKQLYYTSCRTGKSVGGSSGFQIRASSPNVAPDRLKATISYVGYALPQNVIPTEQTCLTSPVRLAFLDTPDAGKILCHGVYIGKDPMTGRFGNFYSHTLLNLPDGFQAEEAIRTWRSDFWKKSDDDKSSALEDIDSLPDGDISITQFIKFISDEANKKMFLFLLKAICIEKEGCRIFIAAPAQEIALCVFGITQALPKTVLKNFTFSTYESDPLSCRAKLIGTWLGEGTELELPSSCYRGTSIGFNKLTGKKSDLQDSNYYVDNWISKMQSEQSFEGLTKFRKQCESLKIESISLLFKFFQLKLNQDLPSNENILELLTNENISSYCLFRFQNRAELLKKIFSESKLDEDFHQQIFPLLGRTINSSPNLNLNIEGVNSELKLRLKSWASITSFLNSPKFDEYTLTPISNGIKIDMTEDADQKKVLSQIIDLTITSMFNRDDTESDTIKTDLENILHYIGNSLPKGPQQLYKLFSKPYLKVKHSYPNNTILRESLIEIGLGFNVRFTELNYSSFGNRLSNEVKKYLVDYTTKAGSKDFWDFEKKTKAWDPSSKRRWKEITDGIIDRSSLLRKIARRFSIFLLTVVLTWSFLDEFKLKKYLPFSRFFSGLNNGFSWVSGLLTSSPEDKNKKATTPATTPATNKNK